LHKTTQFLGMLALLLAMQQTTAKDRPFIDETDNSIREDYAEKEWKEGQVSLPKSYKAENLQQFKLPNSNSRFQYFIDRNSLLTGDDGVTRFILVIRSSHGVDNSSYEGIHCGEREYTVYAYGGKQGFKPLSNPTWRRITRSGPENYRETLYNNLLCNLSTGEANRPEAVIQAMQLDTTVEDNPIN